jgi:hypothetical protein
MRLGLALCAGLCLAAAKAPQPSDGQAATPDKLAAKLFPTVPGFRMVEGPTDYAPGNLFEYIDGGADAFLQFDLQGLQTATYANPQKVEVTVDIYRHKDAERAYGMYTQERPMGTTPIAVGVDAYAGADHLELVTGPFYVKLVQAGPKAAFALRLFAERIAAKLGGQHDAPAVLKAFPDRGKLARAEKLAAHNFLGHAFLHDGVAVPYQLDGVRFRLFAIHGQDEADARQMVERYRTLVKVPASEVRPSGSEILKDPYNGEVLLRWQGPWLWGAVDQMSPHRQQLVDELGQGLLGDKH